MVKFIFLIISIFLINTAFANSYFFSTSLGDDNRSVEEAQNPMTPWQTINKLNSFSNSLKPGDGVFFNRGETFYGAITISNLFASTANPILFGAYGTGEKPIISGLSSILDWTSIDNGIYEKVLNFPLTNLLNMVIFQDLLQPIGRWPKVSESNAGYLDLQSHDYLTSITSNAISSAPNFVGGELVVRSNDWIINRARIIDQSSDMITYIPFASRDNAETYEPQDGFGFFFQNHINALTQLGDWMYDSLSNKFRMYFGDQNPDNYSVNVASIENLVNINNNSHMIFDGISFKGANSNTFHIQNSSNISIKNCDINCSGTNGIFVSSAVSSFINIDNCNILNSNNNAINANSSTNWIIQNNFINNTGLNRGMGLSGDASYIAVCRIGSNSLVMYNDIRNTGYSGIEFVGGSVEIKNNFIDSFCVIKSDGGGIYTFAERDAFNRKVTGNIVLDGIGDRFGKSLVERNNPFSANVHGIYLDGGAGNVDLANNTIANCGNSGVELSSAVNVNVTNNTFYNNTVTQIYYFESRGPISNLTFTDNIAFAKESSQLIAIINSNADRESDWGNMNNNYYCRPVSEPHGVDTSGYSHSPLNYDYPDGGIIQAANNRFYSLDKWTTIANQDDNTKKTPIDLPDLSNHRFEYNATNSDKNIALDGVYLDVKMNIYSGNIILKPYSSIILLNYLNFVKSDQSIIFSPIEDVYIGNELTFPLQAMASSGLPVNYKIISGPAILIDSTITITDVGTVSIEASQLGNDIYNAASSVIQSFNVYPDLIAKNKILKIQENISENIAPVFVYSNSLQSLTNIQINPTETGQSGLFLFDFQGRVIKHLYSGRLEKNKIKSIQLSSSGIPAGIYIIGLVTKTKIIAQKISLVN